MPPSLNALSVAPSRDVHLLVDARPLSGRHNGIGRYVENLFLEVSRLPGVSITLASNRPITTAIPLSDKVRLLVDDSRWSRVPGTIWFSVRAPMLATQLTASHIIGTQHVLPPFMPSKVKGVVIMHDLVYRKFPETMTWQNLWLSRLLVGRSVAIADRVVCVSRSTRDDVLETFGVDVAKCSVAYPGRPAADMDTFRPFAAYDAPSAPLNLLFVGSMEPRKNLDKLIRVFLALRERLPCRLNIVSGNAWGNALSEVSRTALDTCDDIVVHRGIDDAALYALYRGADCLVMPSLYEGFGLPLLESVGRCAIVANDVPIFREIRESLNGLELVDFGRSDASLADYFVDYANRPRKPAEFQTPELGEQFQWSAAARVLAAAVQSR